MATFLMKILTCLQNLMTMLFGTDDDESFQYWTIIFEQKILSNDIGIPFQLSKEASEDRKLLAEFELALVALSRDDDKLLQDFNFSQEGDSTDEKPCQDDTADFNCNRPVSPELGVSAEECHGVDDERGEIAKDKSHSQNETEARTDNSLTYLYTFNKDVNVFTEEQLPMFIDDFQKDTMMRSKVTDLEDAIREQNRDYILTSKPVCNNGTVAHPSRYSKGRSRSNDGKVEILTLDDKRESWEESLDISSPHAHALQVHAKDDIPSRVRNVEDIFVETTCLNADSVYSEALPTNSTDSCPFFIRQHNRQISERSLDQTTLTMNVNCHNYREIEESEEAKEVKIDLFDKGNHECTLSTEVDLTKQPIPKIVTKCPIEGCTVPGCYLSQENPDEESRYWFLRTLCQTKRRILSYLYLDVSPFDRPKPMHRVKVMGTDLTLLRTRQFVPRPQVESTDLAQDPKDFEEFLESFQFDLAQPHLSQDENPLVRFQKYLGLKKKPFPRHPYRPHVFNLMTVLRRSLKSLQSSCARVFFRYKLKSKKHSVRTVLQRAHNILSSFMKEREEPLYLTGSVAFKFYRMLASVEMECRKDDLLREREMMMKHYKWKHDTLKHIVMLARDYYRNPTDSKRHEWKKLKNCISRDHRSDTDLRYNVSQIPERTTVFTFLVMLGQILFLMGVLIYAGFGHVGLSPEKRVVDDVMTYRGPQRVTHYTDFNPWFGPSNAGLAFGPCLRMNYISRRKARVFYLEPVRKYYGCCEIKTQWYYVYGVTSEHECFQETDGNGTWTKGLLCREKKTRLVRASETTLLKYRMTVIRPCCVGLLGKCIMVSNQHCAFVNGIFHARCSHCSMVNCLNNVCRLSFLDNPLEPIPQFPWRVEGSGWKQKHRIVFSLLSSHGIASLIPVLLLEAILMRTLEHYIGWHRVAIIYIISALASILSQLAFQVEVPAYGALGGAMGIFGVVIVELILAWNLLPHPWLEALKLTLLMVAMLVMGSLPMVSQTSILAGLLTGAITGLMVVPYMTFNFHLGAWRGRLVVLSFVLLVHLFVTLGIFTFYIYVEPSCELCDKIECIPYIGNEAACQYDHLYNP